ncbi:DUF2199 domain-containing protein [Piscinibacter terrae]|uniref:DUF2199 domain-containing protein n=1 Tax=Piscinibacter terrae TaxID=2496871 RepID=A0A3N7HV60_9BURK|nr:DUF2199 domain-containing protein [Albitalea terrae]RQP25226.1 DUF2199 domain-containing protein [Albitalea terrae]
MAAIFSFKCSCCGEIHEGSPSYAFKSPDHYHGLTDEQKASMGHLSSDFCTITHDDGTDYFIRAILEVPIHGVEEPFLWGLWASLSEKSFKRYVETYDEPVAGDVFFGWVCNAVPWYPPHASSLAANVVVQVGGQRPLLHLHQANGDAHPLILDQRHGITVAKAQEIAEFLQHQS